MTRFLTSTALVLSLTACGGLVDIRPDALKGEIDPAVQEDGARRFRALLDVHGGMETWEGLASVETTFRDEWTNWLFFQVTPYAENNQRASLTSNLHGFPDSRIEFLEGEGTGEVWTAKGTTIVRERDGETERTQAWGDAFFAVFVQNPEFMIATPFRLATADKYAYVGTRSWKGTDHDVVMLSWGDFAPQERVDQWLLYIDPRTGRLAATEFTVRMSGGSQTGFYHFHDYTVTDGLLLAHAMDAYLDKDDETPVHRYRFDDFTFTPAAPPPATAVR
ncbi:MAG: hypothetical protein AAF211_25590, partial [Myxococcota bacterium]